ncbi:hypothetical protein J2Y69_000058 [Microbacterium resistens]|uniref:Uncharacterized protein n=1 Tax=Microbacterium resistens TaxID=156977 RepID=A0ABU1S7A4_9MICO|nr:hypothetical protein [Microbacterium resistens]MDR6865476.1 hypothetical protein [Microbacterium resistens]
MLQLMDSEAPPAYAVPWLIDRRDRTHPVVANGDTRTADFVRVFASTGTGVQRTQLWGRVAPGEQLEICLCDVDPDDLVLTLAWFRPGDGLEYVWRFVV